MRKLILSRKGFDGSYGGIPSPILPDGRMVPLPIPSDHDDSRMADVSTDQNLLAQLLSDLSGRTHSLRTRVHLDPDLNRGPRPRHEGWRPALGQSGAAQSHLARQGVGPGDAFLFFGWFRQVERTSQRWRYSSGAPNLHVLFGWLEIEAVLPIVTQRAACLARHPWIAQHAHVANPRHYTNPRNTLYIAPTRSKLMRGSPGGGQFKRYDAALQLTAENAKRSEWSLPRWFMPSKGRVALTYHGNPARWAMDGQHCRLQTVAKGQEFVLDLQHYPEAVPWVSQLLFAHAR